MILLVTCDVAWVGCFLRSSWLSWRFVPLRVNIPEENLVSKWIRSFWGPIYGASDDFWACFFFQERGNYIYHHISQKVQFQYISMGHTKIHQDHQVHLFKIWGCPMTNLQLPLRSAAGRAAQRRPGSAIDQGSKAREMAWHQSNMGSYLDDFNMLWEWFIFMV